MSAISRFFSSISTKVLLILSVLFALIIALVIYLINTQGYPKIKAESENVVQLTGENAIDIISANINSMERVANEASTLVRTLPQEESYWHDALQTIVNDDTKGITANIAYWPAEGVLDNAVNYRLVDGEYVKAPTPPNFRKLPFYKTLQNMRPKRRCAWSQAVLSKVVKDSFATTCIMRIGQKDGSLMAGVTVSATLDEVVQTVRDVQKQTGGYVLFVDGSNQIIASSDTQKIPNIATDGRQIRKLSQFVEENNGFKPVFAKVNGMRDALIGKVESKVPDKLLKGLYLFDKKSKLLPGSSLIGFAAYNAENNLFVHRSAPNFIAKVSIEYDSVLDDGAEAYLFNEPNTLWKLIIVKPNREINAIATNFRNTLLQYLLGALVLTGLLTYFFINRSALRPIIQTAKQSQQAAEVIEQKEYSLLSNMQLPTGRNDEIGYLNKAMNGLLTKVEENEGQLAYINKELENKVEERTNELQTALSDLKSSQVQLIRSEKMATLGQMVAGVAHEINTPLTYVQTNLEMIGLTADDYERLFEPLDELKILLSQPKIESKKLKETLINLLNVTKQVKEDSPVDELRQATVDSLFGVEQISDLVLNMRDFARLDESKTKSVDLRECVKSSLLMAKNNIKGIAIQTTLPEIPLVSCSPSQINQVLMNLINNAAQAIPSDRQGKLHIAVRADENYAHIRVQDNGVGMSDEVQSKIFEPFYTTKKAGEGTGLGMAISQQIIEQHDGRITVVSKVDEGTIFTISLPIAG